MFRLIAITSLCLASKSAFQFSKCLPEQTLDFFNILHLRLNGFRYVDQRPVIVSVEKGSVAEDGVCFTQQLEYFSQSERTVVIQGVLQPGDVLDEVFGVATRPLRIHQVLQMLRSNKGVPIELGIVKVSTAVLCRGSVAHTSTYM